MNNRQEKPPLKCLLGIDPEKTQKCKPSECASCGRESDSFTGGVCDACREKLLQNAGMLRDYAESDVADYLNYCAEIYGDMAAS